MIGINKGALKPFDPNLKLELKFNYQTYTDGAGTVAATTNDYVRAWRSTVGGHLLTQSTDAARPQRQSDGLYFDGGDSLAIAHNSAFMDFGASNFSIAFYVNFSSLAGFQGLLSQLGATVRFCIRKNSDNKIYFFATTDGNVVVADYYSEILPLSVGVWYHFALVRNGATMLFFVNGVSKSFPVGTTAISTMPTGTGDLSIGTDFANTDRFIGKMTDLQIYKNTAKYTANFTPPTRSA